MSLSKRSLIMKWRLLISPPENPNDRARWQNCKASDRMLTSPSLQVADADLNASGIPQAKNDSVPSHLLITAEHMASALSTM